MLASPNAKSSQDIIRLAESLIGGEKTVCKPSQAGAKWSASKSAAGLLGAMRDFLANLSNALEEAAYHVESRKLSDRKLTVQKEDEQQFNRLKLELHERLVGSLNLSLVRTVDPAWLREELRRGADELCNSHVLVFSVKPIATASWMNWFMKHSA